MSTKFGLLIDFDLLKAAISINVKPEIVLSGRCGKLDKAIWRPNRSNTISGFAFVDIARDSDSAVHLFGRLSVAKMRTLNRDVLKKTKQFRATVSIDDQ